MTESINPGGAAISVGGSAASGKSSTGGLAVSGLVVGSFTPGANSTVVGSQVVTKQPDEEVAWLTKMDVRVLLDGDISGARAGRDMYVGIFLAALVGLICLVAATWDEIFTQGKWGWAIWIALMIFIVGGSGVGAVITMVKLHRVSNDSAYSNLIERLQKHFGIK